jgi:hypothetical protein
MTSCKPKGHDPKLKPWRKGKSKNANKKGSIKSQIRSKQRLLHKITDEEIKKKLNIEIQQLEIQLKSNKKKELERKFAAKYHQVKFFERQKLTRMEKKIQNKLKDAKAAVDLEDVEKYQKQLEQICMDQLYVAYYPNDEKYIALFANNGVRVVDDDTTWNKREQIRKKIIHRIQTGQIDCTKSWVNMKVLKDKDFVVDMKNIVMDEQHLEKVKMIKNEQRFQHDTTTFKFETFNKNNEENEYEKNEGLDDNLHSSEKTRKKLDKLDEDNAEQVLTIGQSDSSSSSSDSSSSDSSSSESDDSDSEGDDDDDDDDDRVKSNSYDQEDISNYIKGDNDDVDSEDDFLLDDSGKGDIKEVFKHAKRETHYEKKGDKSQGWKTQKQQPHQWKRHRTR